MVIETQEQYSKLLGSIKNKNIVLSFVRDDFRTHPSNGKIVAASIYFESKTYNVVFTHSESDANLDVEKLSCVKRFFVDDAKQFYNLTGFDNVYDVKLMSWVNGFEYEEIIIDTVFEFIHGNTKNLANTIVPIVKVIGLCNSKLSHILEMWRDLKINKPALKYNNSALQLAKIEHTGMKTISGNWNSNYNMLTSTGRPSNTFAGVNFAALNKTDGSRKQIVSRFDKGMLIELDYDAYHLRLLGKIFDYQFPLDQSVHQYFADNVYKCTYEESKTKSFQILYGSTPFSAGKGNEFFTGVADLARVLASDFNKNKYFQSHIYRKPFNMENVVDVNKNKLLNYYIQSYETERNYKIIEKIHGYLKGKTTQMILYTYDSFLFDFNIDEGLDIIKNIKKISELDGFPVKVKAGTNYDNLNDITKRLQ